MKSLIVWLLSCFLLTRCVPVQERPDIFAQSSALKLVDQGSYYLRIEDLEQAKAAFEVAAELAALPQAYDGLGCVSFLSGEIELAERYFIKAATLDPEYYQALANLAQLYESQGLFQKAEEVYQFAIRGDPGNFRTRNNFGVFLAEYRGANQTAQQELAKAYAVTPHPLIEKNLERLANYEK